MELVSDFGAVAAIRYGSVCMGAIEPRGIEVIAVPPNQQLQLTVESVTPFAKQSARHFRLQLS